MQKIYFDNAATTKPRQEVIDIMVDCMKNSYANPDSIHKFGIEASKIIAKYKDIFDNYLGLDKNSIYFTSGGAEGNSVIINSSLKNKKKGNVVTTPIEHPSILETLKSYTDIEIRYVKVNEYGEVDIDSLKDIVDDDTILVTIGFVNSEIGTIQDIKQISSVVKNINKNIIFHTDFVQGLGHINIDFKNYPNVDAISMSSHKIYGPKGIGAIYINKKLNFKKVVYGNNKLNDFIPRTMPTELILGFLKSMSLLNDNEIKYLDDLKQYCKNRLLEIDNIHINSPYNSSPSILNFSTGVGRGEIILNYLSSKNIYVSTGSACSSSKKTSHVLSSIGLSQDKLNTAIRLSFSIYNTKEEIDIFINELKQCLELFK